MGFFSNIGSGMSGAFLAGATKRISADWKEDQTSMNKKIDVKTKLFYDEVKNSIDARKEERKVRKAQYDDAVALFGNDADAGAVAQAMARLSPEEFQRTREAFRSAKATAESKNTGTSLSELGITSRGTADSASGELVGATAQKAIDSEKALDNIMGTLQDNTSGVAVDSKDKDSIKKSFRRRVGSLSSQEMVSEAESDAADQLGITVQRLRAIREDSFTGMQPPTAGVDLGFVDPSAVREIKQADTAFQLTQVQLDNALLVQQNIQADADLANAIDEYTNPLNGEKQNMTGRKYSSLLSVRTAEAALENTMSQIQARGTETNWTPSKLKNFKGNVIEGAISGLDFNASEFVFNRSSIDNSILSVRSRAEDNGRAQALVVLTNVYTDSVFSANENAGDRDIMRLLASGSSGNFAREIINLYTNDDESGAAGTVKLTINNLGEAGQTLIKDFKKLIPKEKTPSIPTAPSSIRVADQQTPQEEDTLQQAIERVGLGSRTGETTAPPTPRPAPVILPAVTPAAEEPATDIRGMPISDIQNYFEKDYARLENVTTPYSSDISLTIDQNNNKKTMISFLTRNRKNLNLSRDNIKELINNYNKLNTENSEGVRATPEIVQKLIDDNKDNIKQINTAAPPAKEVAITPAQRTDMWSKSTNKDVGKPLGDTGTSTFSRQERAFKSYLANLGYSFAQQTRFWISYAASNTGNIDRSSIDKYIKNTPPATTN